MSNLNLLNTVFSTIPQCSPVPWDLKESPEKQTKLQRPDEASPADLQKTHKKGQTWANSLSRWALYISLRRLPQLQHETTFWEEETADTRRNVPPPLYLVFRLKGEKNKWKRQKRIFRFRMSCWLQTFRIKLVNKSKRLSFMRSGRSFWKSKSNQSWSR